MFLQHDDASPHTSVATSVAIESIRFEVVPHLPNSLDLTPSDIGCLQLSRHASKEFLHMWCRNGFRNSLKNSTLMGSKNMFSSNGFLLHLRDSTWENEA
jgi:hypothetical protein